MCGAILLREGPSETLAEKFNYIKSVWAAATGQTNVHFGNSHYLSLRNKGSRAYCQGYMMNEANAFPGDELEKEEIGDVIDYYFMNQAIEATCHDLAAFAGTLAGGGVCPTTNERVFQSVDVSNCLSMMSSCGMGDSSGKLQFNLGFPCTTGSSGFVIMVVPNLGGFAAYSPRLDLENNSVFGVHFFTAITKAFHLHTFNSFAVQDSSVYSTLIAHSEEPHTADQVKSRINANHDTNHLMYAAAHGDVHVIRRLYARGTEVTFPDYDGRTPLHLAASNGQLEAAKVLVMFGADQGALDRNGNSPLDDALREKHTAVAEWLQSTPELQYAQVQGSSLDPRSLRVAAREDVGDAFRDLDCGDSETRTNDDIEDDAPEEAGTEKGVPRSSSHLSMSKHAEEPGRAIAAASGLRNVATVLDIINTISHETGSEGDEAEHLLGSPIHHLMKHGSPQMSPMNGLNLERVDRWVLSLSEVVGDSNVVRPPTDSDLAKALGREGVDVEDSRLAKDLAWSSLDVSRSSRSLVENGKPVLEPISRDRLKMLVSRHPYIQKILEGEAVVANTPSFRSAIEESFRAAESDRSGQVAQYIPELARVNPEQFGVGVCTIDAQQFSFGDCKVPFCVQSCMKPINYCIAQELVGAEIVHKHVSYEPSGLNFNELTLNKKGLPHNPLINAGAIMTSSLILPEASSEDRFDYVTSVWERLTGGDAPGYSNETFLGEFATADRNFCLSYLMKENLAFPSYVNSSSALRRVLEFYLSCCSIEQTCETMSVVAATLANGGVNPLTQEKVFRSETVRNCLAIMSSSGMYDFSGEFQFTIGVPAKSGVSGCLLVVIPNVMGFCVWSPRLDKLGNSSRGIRFCEILQQKYAIHRYSRLRGASSSLDPRELNAECVAERRVYKLIEAATRGDVKTFKLLASESNFDMNRGDYDGRTALHLAAAEGHLRFVTLLVGSGVNVNPIDRWGCTPIQDARRQGHEQIVQYLLRNGAKMGKGKQAPKVQ